MYVYEYMIYSIGYRLGHSREIENDIQSNDNARDLIQVLDNMF